MLAQTIVGRLTSNFVEGKTLYRNSDGSMTALLNLAVPSKRKLRNPKQNSTNEYATDFFTVEAFISKETMATSGGGIYPYLAEGDLITADIEFRASENEAYTDANGKRIYKQKWVVIGSPEPLETIEVRRARQASKQGQPQAQEQAAPQAQPAPQPQAAQQAQAQAQPQTQNQGAQPQAAPQSAGSFQTGANPFGSMPSN